MIVDVFSESNFVASVDVPLATREDAIQRAREFVQSHYPYLNVKTLSFSVKEASKLNMKKHAMCINLPTLRILEEYYDLDLSGFDEEILEEVVCTSIAGGALDTYDAELLFDPTLRDIFTQIVRAGKTTPDFTGIPQELFNRFYERQEYVNQLPEFKKFQQQYDEEMGYAPGSAELPIREFQQKLQEKWEQASNLRQKKIGAQKFIDQLKKSKDPENAEKGYGYFITWADGRARVGYKTKSDAIDFIGQDSDWMDVVDVKYREAEKGERVRNKFTEASAKTYKAMKKAWDNPQKSEDYHPGSNVSGPVPYSVPKSPGSKPRREQRTKDDYHAPSQLDRDPIPGEDQPEQGTGGQSHSGEPRKPDNIYPEPLNWLRPLKGLPFIDEHLLHDFNEDFDTEYYIRQRGLNMRRHKFALNMKKAQQIPKWTDPEYLSNKLYGYIKQTLQHYQDQIRKNPEFGEDLMDESMSRFIEQNQQLFVDAGVTLPIILEAIKDAARLLMVNDKIGIDTLPSEQKAIELYPDPREKSYQMSQMTMSEARILDELTSDQIWDIARNPGTENTPLGDTARSLIQKGIVASRLNMKKKSIDIEAEANRIAALWKETARAAGSEAVLDLFADRTNVYNTVMADIKGLYSEEDAHAIALRVIDLVPQIIQIGSSKLNMKKKAAVNPKYDYGVVQTSDVSETVTNAIKDIQGRINKDKLYDGEDESGWVENGIQKLFHITVLFGVNNDVKDEVKKVFDKYRPVHIETTEIKYFSSDPNYDVAIVRCKSEELTKIHNELKDTLENEETYPNYKPHITIAYLKKGERLDDSEQITNISWEVDSLDLSTSDGKLEKISALAIPIRESLDYPHSWRKRKKKKKDEKIVTEKEKKILQMDSNKLSLKKKADYLDDRRRQRLTNIQFLLEGAIQRGMTYDQAKAELERLTDIPETTTLTSEEIDQFLQKYFPKEGSSLNEFSSILDEPRAELDPAIWSIGEDNLPFLKPDVKIHIVKNFFDYISQFGGYIRPEEFVKNMFFTGSTATYTYADKSDIDIHIVVDWNDLAALNPDKARKDPKEMWQELHDIFWWTLNKIKLEGTKHPLTYYVVPPGEEKKILEAKEELYDIGHGVWICPPGEVIALPQEAMSIATEEASDIMSRIEEHLTNARKDIMDYDMLKILEKLNNDNTPIILQKFDEILKTLDEELVALKDEYALLKQKRQEGFELGKPIVPSESKNYTMGNIIFKLVERYKLMNVLREIKRITDAKPIEHAQVDDVADALGFEDE